jgi:GT2 family glycosyltransferase
VNDWAGAELPRATIVIVALRDNPKLRTCLGRLAALTDKTTFETLVALNGRPREDAQQLVQELARDRFVPPGGVRMIECPVNLGLPGALNRARPIARGEFLISLHDDAEPADGWLDGLVSAADESGAGAVGSLVLNPDRSVQAAGWELYPDGITRPPWKDAPPGASDFTSRVAVDYSPSCSLLVRVSSWDRIGGVDERFFPLLYVDVDLCMALRARGEQVMLEPSSVVVHHRGSSITTDYQEFVWERNRARFVDKWGALLTEHVPGRGRTWSLPEDAIPRQDRQLDEAARERAQLMRGVATAEAFSSRLRDRLAAMDAEREQTHDAFERTHADLVAAYEELERTHERLAAVDAELRIRAEKLARIEAGGWWRLRSRLLPLLRIAAAIRRSAGRDVRQR